MTALRDNHGRPINYLRLAVTDRCNLRCFYCMPAQGIRYLPRKDLLSFEEIERMVSIMASMGISKVRLTGGEPFLRNDMMKLAASIVAVPGVKALHITTNGVLTAPHIPTLKRMGVASINLSLDTLDRVRFRDITRRDEFEQTWRCLQLILEHGIPLKINAVVMEGQNIDDIIPLAELARDNNVGVRFIEEMPFNGNGAHYIKLTWTSGKILSYLKSHYPDIQMVTGEANATATNYSVPGFRGTLGIIAAYSRTFCGSCNRIRVTAQGMLKTCLYDDGVLNVRDLMRSGAHDDDIRNALLQAFNKRPANGFEAEGRRHASVTESMSTIGG